MANLMIELFGHKFLNPIWLGSGSLVDSQEKVKKYLKTDIGAIVPRTTRLNYAPNRSKHPSYHLDLDLTEKTIRNCEWTGNLITYWLPFLATNSKSGKIIMSVSGRNIDDCLKVCKRIDSYNYPYIEINISCAHSNEVHGFINRNSAHIKKLVKTLKMNIKTPIALKLGHSDFIIPLAKVAEENGVDAIVAINTYGPVIDFDINHGKPKLKLGTNNGMGGLSGKHIFKIALTDIFKLKQNLKIPIIASGGICSPEDAIKMIMAGASAVQLYSAVHLEGVKGDLFIKKFLKDFSSWLDKYNYKNIKSLQNKLSFAIRKSHNINKKIPKYKINKCIHCNKCKDICIESAISINLNKIIINKNKCIGCGACTSICPVNALE